MKNATLKGSRRRRLLVGLAAALAVGAFAGPALAEDATPQAQTPPAESPFPAKKVDVAMYVDTVTSTRGVVVQKRGCAQTNLFPRESRVVYRMWAVDTKTGLPVTDADVQYVYIKIPGLANQKLNWGGHGAAPNRVYFWSLGWAVPADYSLGVVKFRIVLKTNDGRFGTYEQPAVENAQLTVVPRT